MKTYRFQVARSGSCRTCQRAQAEVVLQTSEQVADGKKTGIIRGKDEPVCFRCLRMYYPDEVLLQARTFLDDEHAKHAPVALTNAPGVSSSSETQTPSFRSGSAPGRSSYRSDARRAVAPHRSA